MESSDSEPDVKKRRNVRKSIAATKKFFQCPKGKLGKGKKEKEKVKILKKRLTATDSGTEDDQDLEDWSAEEKDQQVVNDSLEEDEEEEAEEDKTFRLSNNEDDTMTIKMNRNWKEKSRQSWKSCREPWTFCL